MAANVFGTPITNETLKRMPKYMEKKDITNIDRATVAVSMKNAERKDANARQFVENLQDQFTKRNPRDATTTMVVVYNASGDELILRRSKDWIGHLGESSFPVIIYNGQWGAFLHVFEGNNYQNSQGGIMFEGKNSKEAVTYWVLCWKSAKNDINKVYTKLYNSGNMPFDLWNSIKDEDWGPIHQVAKTDNAWLSGVIGGTSNPICEGIMTLPEFVK